MIYAGRPSSSASSPAGIEPTDAVAHLHRLLRDHRHPPNARLRVGEPGGPVETDAQPLEARFQAMAAEQAEAAPAAGLPGCAFDVNDTIFGS